jgi:AcrR family transcriptional regulator
MRVTAHVKEQTEDAILAAARKLFLRSGVEATSTRDIAKAAKIGVGTLFNYFSSKEELALAVAAEAFEAGRLEALRRIEHDAAAGSSLEMDLFTLTASDLRALLGLRGMVGDLVDSGLGRFVNGPDERAATIRVMRVSDAERVLERYGVTECASTPLMHLYWSLYLGVLSFWARDESPNQEDTLALLDQGIRMFTGVAAHSRASAADRGTNEGEVNERAAMLGDLP